MPPGEAHRQWSHLTPGMATRSAEQTLRVASAIWAQEDLEVHAGFVADSRTAFAGDIHSLDFGSPEAASTINRWAAEQTRGVIPSIVQEVDPRSLLLLTNAVYFQAPWETPFRGDGTHDAAFGWPDGSEVPVSMMSREDHGLQCVETPSFVMVRLPYQGSQTSMYLALPNQEVGLEGLLRVLTGKAFVATAKFAAETLPRFVVLRVPRLDLTWDRRDLADVLSAMGMPAAFDASRADFSGIAQRRPLFIGQFAQKTRIRVGELGTEAAAVSYEMMVMGFPPAVVFNRPFLFGVLDEPSGAVLFLGVVHDPQAR